MDDLSRYAQRPFGFYLRYVRLRLLLHAGILLAGFAAAICAVGTQYGLKYLVDALSGSAGRGGDAWFGFGLLIGLLAADHLLSRLGGVIASVTFPRVTADLRSDIFRHVMGHSPRYFADRLPGTLTSRITATSNAVIALENMFAWNVLPPIVGNICAGVWESRGIGKVVEHHIGWTFDGNGNPSGYFTLVQDLKLGNHGTTYSGPFDQKFYDNDGNLVNELTGDMSAERFTGQ